MAYSNNAYDLDHFAPRTNAAPKKSQQKKAVIKKFPQKQIAPSPNKGIILNAIVAIVIVLMVCYNIYLRTEINDTKNSISKANKQIETLMSEQTQLNVEFEKLVSFSSLEEQAIKLGMQKRSESQIHYIDTSSEDYAEVIKK
ncbi:MAG: hypothetical protein ACI39F_08490 [Acutalibacteraceae bacterium]